MLNVPTQPEPPARRGLQDQEAFLSAVRRTLLLGSERVALFDVGDLVTEVIVGHDDGCFSTMSLGLGVRRLRDGWTLSDPPTERERAVMADWAWTVLNPAVQCARDLGFDLVVLTSDSAATIAQLAGDERRGTARSGRLLLARRRLLAWETKLAGASARERGIRWGLPASIAGTIVPGIIIVRTLLELAAVDVAQVCAAAPPHAPRANALGTRSAAEAARPPRAVTLGR